MRHLVFNRPLSPYQRLHLVIQVLLLLSWVLWVPVMKPLKGTQEKLEQ